MKTHRHPHHPKRPAAPALIAICAALALGTPAVQAQDKAVQIKLSSWVPAQHPLNPALQAWADDIKKESGGTITAILFPSEQLGNCLLYTSDAADE